MALPPLQVKKRKRRAASTAQSAPAFKPLSITKETKDRLSAQKIAEDKGFQFKDITDFAKDSGPVVLNALTDTLSAPQRNIGSVLSGDGLVDPYSQEAEKYDPSDLLVKGPGKLTGLKGFAADVLLDPLNVTGVKVLANVAVKGSSKAALKELAEQSAKYGSKPNPRVLDKSGELVKLPKNYASRPGASKALVDESQAIGLDIGYKASQAKKPLTKRIAGGLLMGSTLRKALDEGAKQLDYKIAGSSEGRLSDELKQTTQERLAANREVQEAEAASIREQDKLAELNRQRGEAIQQQGLQNRGTRQKVSLQTKPKVKPFVIRNGKPIELPKNADKRQSFDKSLIKEGQANAARSQELADSLSGKGVRLSAGELRDLQNLHGDKFNDPAYFEALEKQLTNQLGAAAGRSAAASDEAAQAMKMEDVAQTADEAVDQADSRLAGQKELTQEARVGARENAKSRSFDDVQAIVKYDPVSGKNVIEYRPYRYIVNSAQRTKEVRRSDAGKAPVTNEDLVNTTQNLRQAADDEVGAKAAYFAQWSATRKASEDIVSIRRAGSELRSTARSGGRTEGRAAGAIAAKDQKLVREYTQAERGKYQAAKKVADESEAELLTAQRQYDYAVSQGNQASVAKASKELDKRLAKHKANVVKENAARADYYAKRDEFVEKAAEAKSKVARGRPGRSADDPNRPGFRNPGKPNSRVDKLLSRFNTPGRQTADALFRSDAAVKEANQKFLDELDAFSSARKSDLDEIEGLRRDWVDKQATRQQLERQLRDLEQRRAAQELGGPYNPRRTTDEVQKEAEGRAIQKSLARKNKRNAKTGAKQIKVSLSTAAGTASETEQVLKQLAAIRAFKSGRKAEIPGAPREGKITAQRARVREARKTSQQKRAEAAKIRERSSAAQDQGAQDMARQIDISTDVARTEVKPNVVATGIGLRLGPKNIPLIATTNENLVKVAKAGSKVPFIGAGGKALNEAFNPARKADKRVYLANRIITHAGTSFTERDMGLIDRALEGVPASNQRIVNEIFQLAAYKPLIRGNAPESWAKQIDDLTEEVSAAKAMLVFRQGDMTKTAIAREQKRIANIDEAIGTLKEMDSRWSTLADSGKNSYKMIRKWYDDKLVKAKAFGLLDNATSQANYVYSKKLTRGERTSRRAATAGSPTTDAAFMKQKVTDGLPEDYDVFEWARAYSRDFNRAVFNRQFTKMIAFEFGVPRSVANTLGSKDGDYIKYDKASSLLGTPVYLPKEIDESVKRLVDFGSDPNESRLVQIFNDLSSRWKAAAYSNNFGHFLTDSIGDTWNTVLHHGVKIMPHITAAMGKDGPLWITEQFLKALDDGSSLDDVIKVRGKDMKLRDVAKMKVSVGLVNKNEYTVEELAFGFLDAGNRNTGKAAGDVGKRSDTPKANVTKTVEVGGTDVNTPKLLRAYTTKMQRLGNRRDNFSKRIAFVAALSLEASRGKSSALAAREASLAVRRSVFDYSELTAFEKRTARNFIPFYTWTRKNVPYQIRMLAERPVLTQAPLRLQSNLEDEKQPDYNVPDYMRSRSLRIGQLPGPVADLLGQKKNEPFYFNPMLPGFDLKFLQNERGGLQPSQLLGMIAPTVRVPLELASDRPANLQYGADLSGPVFGNNGALPVLGPKGEYMFESFLGQPGRVFSRALDGRRRTFDRAMPAIGTVTGIRGGIADPVKTRKGIESQIQRENQAYVRMLQDSGQVPSTEEIEAMRKRRRKKKLSTKLPKLSSGN
jgi:hypothetical protein